MANVRRRVLQAAVAAFAVSLLVIGSQCARPREGRQPPPPSATQKQTLTDYLALPLRCEDEIKPDRKAHYERTLVSYDVLDNRLLHDCQKLLIDKDHYGPMVGLQVAGHIEKIIAGADSGVVIADIVNFGKAAYPSLNIQPELNCLWVKGNPAQPAGWRVAVRQGVTCTDTMALSPITGYLHVDTVRYASAVHPATARWGWDGRTQFIGITCGRYFWCEFGRVVPETRANVRGETFGLADEQFVSARDDAAAGAVRPSYVWGRIRPYPILADSDSMVYLKPQRVATIVLTSASQNPPPPAATNAQVHAHYTSKFSLKGDSTDLFMKFDLPSRTYFIATDPGRPNWTPLQRCDWKHAAVGAVRWRWAATDEAIWLACGVGCCNTTEIGLQQ